MVKFVLCKCGSAFFTRSHLMARLVFYLLGEILIFFSKKIRSHHLLLFYFFKRENKIRKKIPCDSLFGKYMSAKIESESECQVTDWKGTVKTVIPL